jgi:hypothetical protein
MKNTKLLFAVSAVSVLILASCQPESPLELVTQQGLVSFYNFEGNSNDVFGINDGIDINTTYLSPSGHVHNQVLQLSGTDSYVKIPESFDFEARTISLWFKIAQSTSTLQAIYSSDNPNLAYGLTVLNTQTYDSHINLYFNVAGQTDTAEILTNVWYNATLVADGRNYYYYLNGDLFRSGSFASYLRSNNGDPISIIGCDRTLIQRYFNGLVDNLRIYNRRLSEHEIKVIYNAGY